MQHNITLLHHDVILLQHNVTLLPHNAMYVFLKAQEAHMFLREWLSENVSVGVAVETRIIYGGELSNGVFDCCCHTCPTLTS